MELKVGNRVEVESESPERRPRMGVIEEVVRQGHLRLAIAFAGTTVEEQLTPLRRGRCIAPERARRRRTRADRRAQARRHRGVTCFAAS